MDLLFGLLAPAGLPPWLTAALAGIVPAVLLLTLMAFGPIVYVYAETKIAGFMQDRIGPKRVGPHGMLQTVADAIKLLFKEAIFPAAADKFLFMLAPCLVVLGAFLSFVVIPFGSRLQTADLNVGVFYVIAVSSLSTVGLIMAGWASNNKYALFGAMRSAAQIVSYEIPAVMSLVVVVMMVGSLSLQDIVDAQAGGLPYWLLWRYFPLNIIAVPGLLHGQPRRVQPRALRHPRGRERAGGRLPHRVQRLLLRDVLHGRVHRDGGALGGGLGAVPRRARWRRTWRCRRPLASASGPVWLLAKAWTLVFVMMWLRWTLPRLRVDQLMHVAWKVLLPISLTLVVVVGTLVLWRPARLHPRPLGRAGPSSWACSSSC